MDIAILVPGMAPVMKDGKAKAFARATAAGVRRTAVFAKFRSFVIRSVSQVSVTIRSLILVKVAQPDMLNLKELTYNARNALQGTMQTTSILQLVSVVLLATTLGQPDQSHVEDVQQDNTRTKKGNQHAKLAISANLCRQKAAQAVSIVSSDSTRNRKEGLSANIA